MKDNLSKICKMAEQVSQKNPDIVAAMLCGSIARGDNDQWLDIDLRFYRKNRTDNSDLAKDELSLRDIDYVILDFPDDKKIQDLLVNPYWGNAYTERKILYDYENRLAEIQKVLQRGFMCSDFLKIRLDGLIKSVKRNANKYRTASEQGNLPEMVRAYGFALWTACDALIVLHGQAPNQRRGLIRLASMMPEEYSRIIALLAVVQFPNGLKDRLMGFIDNEHTNGHASAEYLA